ncbi:hypothetical protein L1987_53350 [Smallanthus sonchifolius]|uniref:Uncharacterized protein n=1 Tax=Smallanthus sonchifolius TaxID=185202 RepID=A0ACB9EV03_9ASTR|nr:hypothetical protein L1987_53350 [Smallanthus sonchifolius]
MSYSAEQVDAEEDDRQKRAYSGHRTRVNDAGEATAEALLFPTKSDETKTGNPKTVATTGSSSADKDDSVIWRSLYLISLSSDGGFVGRKKNGMCIQLEGFLRRGDEEPTKVTN